MLGFIYIGVIGKKQAWIYYELITIDMRHNFFLNTFPAENCTQKFNTFFTFPFADMMKKGISMVRKDYIHRKQDYYVSGDERYGLENSIKRVYVNKQQSYKLDLPPLYPVERLQRRFCECKMRRLKTPGFMKRSFLAFPRP